MQPLQRRRKSCSPRSLVLEEDLAGIRAVNINVATGTGLIFRRLIVRRTLGGLGWHTTQRQRMALQAKNIDLAHSQQTWISGTVGHMTTCAALRFYRQVLIYEWTFGIRMTLEANLILRPAGSQLLRQKTAMRIVTVVATYQFLVHPMAIRAGEFSLFFRMTPVAQSRRFLN